MIFILLGITLLDPISANGQSGEKRALIQDSKRDPFLLPSGVHPLSKIETPPGGRILPKPDSKPDDPMPPPLTIRTILISDHARLALIDHRILTVGDSIRDEEILEIKADGVVLGKGNQKRTLFLSQSPLRLTVEERKGEKR